MMMMMMMVVVVVVVVLKMNGVKSENFENFGYNL
jgi:hypothetical protein